MIKSIAATFVVAVLLPSCSSRLASPESSPHQELAKMRANNPWWRQLNDPSLNQDIASAFSKNPGLREVALRIDRANAFVAKARASGLPRLNLGFGYQDGRKQEVDFGPYDLAPWGSRAGLSWEIDITGKLRAAQKSAVEKREAAVWDYHSSRLLLASRIASVRMNLYRFNAEIESMKGSISSNQRTLDTLVDRSQAGLIPESVLEKQRAENERLKRDKLDLERFRDLAVVQLRSLRGGGNPSGTGRSSFPADLIISQRPLNELMASHPGVLAAEARVRSAFQLERFARLNLLPSFRFNLLADGAQPGLTDRFRAWIVKAGPSLDLPIYDPSRMAVLGARRAEAQIAASRFRQTIIELLEEVDTARINLVSRRAQLATAKRETQALARTRSIALEQFEAGLTSQVEFLDAERRWLDARRQQAALHQSLLEAQIRLIISTGGGRL